METVSEKGKGLFVWWDPMDQRKAFRRMMRRIVR
jgi:hypothetical protein